MDLDIYNLSPDRIETEWKLVMAQKVNEKKTEIRLEARSDDVYVDVVTLDFPRTDEALGLELVEIAGGRSDGLGITLIASVTDHGVVGRSENRKLIYPGDSLSEISISRDEDIQSQQTEVNVQQRFYSVPIEGLSYDRTAKLIQALPPRQSENERIQLKLKRLRRKPRVIVKLEYPPEQNETDITIEMFAGENLRQGMLVRGVKLNDELAKRFDTKNGGNCGAGGLCRTCAVSVTQGAILLNPQRLAEQQMLKDNPRWRLACKAIVGFGMQEGNMTIRVNPRQWSI